MPFKKEPAFQHGQAERTAVLLCNLGTPDEPTAPALRRYLAEFLGDHRVVEIPRPIWWLILHGIILRTRPAKSARKYASIWTPEGSPLKVWTSRQATLLRAKFNLIPFNPFPQSGLTRSPMARVLAFGKLLNDAGIVTTVRKTRGDDIDAACGQLAGDVRDRTRVGTRIARQRTVVLHQVAAADTAKAPRKVVS